MPLLYLNMLVLDLPVPQWDGRLSLPAGWLSTEMSYLCEAFLFIKATVLTGCTVVLTIYC